MSRTRIVNLRQAPFDVYIGRRGQGYDGYFGNPFVGLHALKRYREHFFQRIETDPEFRRRVLELQGKVLGCFCKPRPCHGDIIVAWLEEKRGETMPKDQKLDGKFYGTIYKNKDGSRVPDDQFVVFLAKDKAFLPTLRFYFDECERQGAEQSQLNAVIALIARVEAWQAAHPELMKVPDVHPGEIRTEPTTAAL